MTKISAAIREGQDPEGRKGSDREESEGSRRAVKRKKSGN